MNTRIPEEHKYGYNKGLTVKAKLSHQPRFKANGDKVSKTTAVLRVTGFGKDWRPMKDERCVGIGTISKLSLKQKRAIGL